MKLLCFLMIGLLLASCSSSTDAAPRKGTLYLQSYIVGGLSIGWLWLGDDGNFVKNPVMGADPINMAVEKTQNAANSGTYTKNGNVISVTYFTGKKENWQMEYLEGKLNTIDGWFVAPQKGMAANYKLKGKFTGNFKVGYVSKQQTYTFNNDGTLTLSGMATVNVDGAGGTSTAEPEKGTYTIKGNTLNIKMNNGDQSIALIGLIPGAKPSIIINYTMFMQ